jgi:hypothetical protein
MSDERTVEERIAAASAHLQQDAAALHRWAVDKLDDGRRTEERVKEQAVRGAFLAVAVLAGVLAVRALVVGISRR